MVKRTSSKGQDDVTKIPAEFGSLKVDIEYRDLGSADGTHSRVTKDLEPCSDAIIQLYETEEPDKWGPGSIND